MKHPKYSHSFEVVAELPEQLKPLRELAYNFRWTWHHETRDLFREMDRQLWEAVAHNPVQFLSKLSAERIGRLCKDDAFLGHLADCSANLKNYLSTSTWFDEAYAGKRADTLIAYFCAEFGISESLPIYSGGLGILAGDHLKAASDLGLPFVAIGLLYSRGYFKQFLSPDGWQQENYPLYDFYQLPLTLVRGEDLQPIRIEVQLPDRVVTCQIWRADVGRIPLYLLDSNILENEPTDQGITDTLYGGDEEMRIRQEMILGVGGMRALEALGLNPTVCHMNEGHAAFLALERIRQYMKAKNVDYRTARQVTVSGNVFTTHTIVPAGFDVFAPDMLERYLSPLANQIQVPFTDLLRIGRFDPENQGEAFNMALLAISNSNHVNGVSKLHASVSRGMFQSRWKDYPEDEVPVEAITNGIHTMTWVCRRMTALFDEYLSPEWRRRGDNPETWKDVWKIPDRDLWAARENQRGDFVRFVRKYLQKKAEGRGLGRASFSQVETVLDPRILTIGFARRFATYKRATLVLTDRQRLKNLLLHKERPIQFVISGKSHPRDDGGKLLIQELVKFAKEEGVQHRMVFLEDYDMEVARAMVQGVDLWLNNPRRPMEASGTSGMKVVPNGVLNCSILDGWWDEAYEPGMGWAIGDRFDVPDHQQQDWLDSRTLYHLIENEIAPNFYHRTDGLVPSAWVEMVKRSIATLAPEFSTSRMVKDYAEKFYMPSAEAYHKLEENDNAAKALAWRGRINTSWAKVRIVSVRDTMGSVNHLGSECGLEVKVDLDGLTPDDVRVQAIVGKVDSNRDLRDVEIHDLALTGQEDNLQVYSGNFACHVAGHRGYTARVLPKSDLVNVPGEMKLVKWE
ncbi:MAG TPA: alpha-glucan family phosphorylase [Fimbriimonadaceae bacterium]|jgi:starch phosphorylase